LDDGRRNMLVKFTDNTVQGRTASTLEDRIKIQKGLDKLQK